MELAGKTNYKQMAEEIGAVLQAAAESADKMQEEARVEAARIRAEAEAELRTACAEGRRILDEARMEADMVRAEAEWQSQEVVAQARRQVAERQAVADARLAAMGQVESRLMDRLAGVGQVLADAMATLREAPGDAVPPVSAGVDLDASDDDRPTAKVFFVEFPPVPAAPTTATPTTATPTTATPTTAAPTTAGDPNADDGIVLTETPGVSLFANDEERSEWAPPGDLPAWWTRGGAQG